MAYPNESADIAHYGPDQMPEADDSGELDSSAARNHLLDQVEAGQGFSRDTLTVPGVGPIEFAYSPSRAVVKSFTSQVGKEVRDRRGGLEKPVLRELDACRRALAEARKPSGETAARLAVNLSSLLKTDDDPLVELAVGFFNVHKPVVRHVPQPILPPQTIDRIRSMPGPSQPGQYWPGGVAAAATGPAASKQKRV
jgi:hypothetical protein